MPSAHRPWSLERLRRSLRLAVFVLGVFVLRVGLVTACAPGDIAEALATSGDVAGLSHDAGETDAKHAAGHCLHCSCHHAVTIPAGLATVPAERPAFELAPLLAEPPSAPPDLSLRPPIV